MSAPKCKECAKLQEGIVEYRKIAHEMANYLERLSIDFDRLARMAAGAESRTWHLMSKKIAAYVGEKKQ